MSFIDEELKDLRIRCEKVVEGSTLIACVPQVVQVKIRRTEFKVITVHFQFPGDYPASPITIELKSQPLDFKLLQGLEKVCTEEAKKYLGKQQMIPILVFVRKFIDDNPLCVCRGEVAHAQTLLEDGDSLKLKQKASQLILSVSGGKYLMKLCFTVPDYYPHERLQIECMEHNWPDVLLKNFIGFCAELARQAVTPPIRKNPKSKKEFVPSPCISKICDFIIKECVKRYHDEKCHACGKSALPSDPKKVEQNPYGAKYVVRIYCSHIYHFKCMDDYMKIPPFSGGKKCLAPGCEKRIFHDNWNISPETAEARWAHKEARQRELDEVIDFLS